MTNDELEEIRARAEAATAGPWGWRWDAILGQWNLVSGVLLADGTDGTPGGDKIDVENATFIAHARADIPALLDALTRAEAHAERLSELLTRALWEIRSQSCDGVIYDETLEDNIEQALSDYNQRTET